MITIADLQALDEEDWSPVTVIAHERSAGQNTYADPQMLVCSDGEFYWAKWRAQQGLVAELVGGRLAARLNSGPPAEVLLVPPGIFTGGGQELPPGHVVGSLNVPDSENLKAVADNLVSQINIDAPSLARVMVLRTWLGVSDAQSLVDLKTGRIHSIDHGDAFGNLTVPNTVQVAANMPRTDWGPSFSPDYVMMAVDAVDQLSDEEMLRAVARVPDEAAWRSTRDRRFQIYQWLIHRRGQMAEVMEKWLTSR